MAPIALAHSPPLEKTSSKQNYAPFLPLLALIVEFLWIALMIIAQLSPNGTVPDRVASRTHALDVLASIPVALGLAAGVFVFKSRRRALSLTEQICLVVGSLGCALFLFSFRWEFFH